MSGTEKHKQDGADQGSSGQGEKDQNRQTYTEMNGGGRDAEDHKDL